MEKHEYHTDDGYINTMFRIRGNPAKRGNGEKVVIFSHGLTETCAGLLADGKESIGYMLVEEGYDLWMNNSRCNRFSQGHERINIENCTQ